MSDLFVRVAMLSMQDPQIRAFLSGIGALELFRELQKAGRQSGGKPHRSNVDLQGRGLPVGMQGQAGLPSMGGLVSQLRPPAIAGMGPASMLSQTRI